MTQYCKKPVVIEATQWFKSGDHPDDNREMFHTEESGDFWGEGKVVRYFRHPDVSGERLCRYCGERMHVHGWIDTLEGGHIVCPADWIITGVKGERYPCKPDIFKVTYEPVAQGCGDADSEQDGNELTERIAKLEAENARLQCLLEDARHELVTLHNLTVTDLPSAYEEAFREGCDANAARDSQREVSWVTDETALIARIDALLAGSKR